MNASTDQKSDYLFSATPGGAPIKSWTKGVPVEEKAWNQVQNVARLPFVHRHVAVMPDVHWGIGATVGSVIPTSGAEGSIDSQTGGIVCGDSLAGEQADGLLVEACERAAPQRAALLRDHAVGEVAPGE